MSSDSIIILIISVAAIVGIVFGVYKGIQKIINS